LDWIPNLPERPQGVRGDPGQEFFQKHLPLPRLHSRAIAGAAPSLAGFRAYYYAALYFMAYLAESGLGIANRSIDEGGFSCGAQCVTWHGTRHFGQQSRRVDAAEL
jgi:hypothetical protein